MGTDEKIWFTGVILVLFLIFIALLVIASKLENYEPTVPTQFVTTQHNYYNGVNDGHE